MSCWKIGNQISRLMTVREAEIKTRLKIIRECDYWRFTIALFSAECEFYSRRAEPWTDRHSTAESTRRCTHHPNRARQITWSACTRHHQSSETKRRGTSTRKSSTTCRRAESAGEEDSDTQEARRRHHHHHHHRRRRLVIPINHLTTGSTTSTIDTAFIAAAAAAASVGQSPRRQFIIHRQVYRVATGSAPTVGASAVRDLHDHQSTLPRRHSQHRTHSQPGNSTSSRRIDPEQCSYHQHPFEQVFIFFFLKRLSP